MFGFKTCTLASGTSLDVAYVPRRANHGASLGSAGAGELGAGVAADVGAQELCVGCSSEPMRSVTTSSNLTFGLGVCSDECGAAMRDMLESCTPAQPAQLGGGIGYSNELLAAQAYALYNTAGLEGAALDELLTELDLLVRAQLDEQNAFDGAAMLRFMQLAREQLAAADNDLRAKGDRRLAAPPDNKQAVRYIAVDLASQVASQYLTWYEHSKRGTTIHRAMAAASLFRLRFAYVSLGFLMGGADAVKMLQAIFTWHEPPAGLGAQLVGANATATAARAGLKVRGAFTALAPYSWSRMADELIKLWQNCYCAATGVDTVSDRKPLVAQNLALAIEFAVRTRTLSNNAWRDRPAEFLAFLHVLSASANTALYKKKPSTASEQRRAAEVCSHNTDQADLYVVVDGMLRMRFDYQDGWRSGKQTQAGQATKTRDPEQDAHDRVLRDWTSLCDATYKVLGPAARWLATQLLSGIEIAHRRSQQGLGGAPLLAGADLMPTDLVLPGAQLTAGDELGDELPVGIALTDMLVPHMTELDMLRFIRCFRIRRRQVAPSSLASLREQLLVLIGDRGEGFEVFARRFAAELDQLRELPHYDELPRSTEVYASDGARGLAKIYGLWRDSDRQRATRGAVTSPFDPALRGEGEEEPLLKLYAHEIKRFIDNNKTAAEAAADWLSVGRLAAWLRTFRANFLATDLMAPLAATAIMSLDEAF
jgi:hypothetical protein